MNYIYTLQNKINNKIYVGITNNMKQRWHAHLSCARHPEWTQSGRHHYIHNAINKYGEDNFTMLELETFEDEQEALDAEQFWIQFFRSWDKIHGYNLTMGGEGTWGRKHTPEHKKKISNSLLGNQNATGTIHTDDTKKKMSISHSGIKNVKAKMTEQIVKDIRNFHSENINNQELDVFKHLSDKYGLSISGLEKIIYRKTWKHI
jgi:group I intron endonuclease